MADPEAIVVGKGDVEQHQVRVVLSGLGQRIRGVARLDSFVAIGLYAD